MSEYSFSGFERFAVFQVHGSRCYMCNETIDLKTMEIDHIIPEVLIKTPELLADHLKLLGLPSEFDVNSYDNWLPACRSCNGKKKDNIYEAAPIHLACLKRARDGAAKCRAAEGRAVRNADVAKSLNYLERAAENEHWDYAKLDALIMAYAKAQPDAFKALYERATDGRIGLVVKIDTPASFPVAPNYTVLYSDGAIQIVKTPRGTGYLPVDPAPHHSFYCGFCGSKGPWNGIICLSCGMRDDGD